jgi:RNA polymerase sigma-70 factor (ECF subfamily)
VTKQLIELVELAKKSDKSAFDEVIRLCVPDLFRIAMSILKNRDDADDTVCEAVAIAYENIHKLNNCEYFKTWIIRILINQAKAVYKKRSKVIYLNDIANEPQYEDVYDLGNDELNAAVASLSLELRIAITLYYFQDMKIKEIASALQVPQGTVKWRLSKAKSILKKRLSEALLPICKEGHGKCETI